MAYRGHIPYEPRTDPKAMFTQGVQNMLAGIEQQFEKKRQIGDVRDVAKYIQGGLRGEPPTPKTEIGMQLMGQVAMQQATQAIRPTAGPGRVGTLPGWWPYGTEQQKQDYMNRVGGPLVQVGEKLLTPKQRQEKADKDFAEAMGLSEAQRNTARKSVKTIVSEMGTRTWKWGTKNYARGNLIQGYKQYRTENDYASKSAENRKWLDDNWDSQMMTYNKAGYKDIGKGEFDWDPKGTKVQALRKAEKIDISAEKLPVYKSAEDRDAHQKVIKVWYNLPKETQSIIATLRTTGASWAEIMNTKELQEALK